MHPSEFIAKHIKAASPDARLISLAFNKGAKGPGKGLRCHGASSRSTSRSRVMRGARCSAMAGS